MAYRRNANNWGFIHPECAPEPGRYSHIPIPAFFGRHVQLIFIGERGVDRMWVMVTGPAETEDQELQGIVDNDPIKAIEWPCGTVIEFLREEIVKVDIIDIPPNPYQNNPVYRRNADDASLRGNPIYRRNADDAYRQAERRVAESGTDEDQARFLREKLRAGEISDEILPLLAYLSYRPAQIILDDYSQIPETLDILSPERLHQDIQRIEDAIRDAYAVPENIPAGLEGLAGGGGVENAVAVGLEQIYQAHHASFMEKITPILNTIVDLCPTLLRITKFNVRYRIVAAVVELYRARLEQGDGVQHTYYRYWKATNLAFLGGNTEIKDYPRPGEGSATSAGQYFLDLMEGRAEPGFEPMHGQAEEAFRHWEVLINMMHLLYQYIGDMPGAHPPEHSPQYYYLRCVAYSVMSLGWPAVCAAIIKNLVPWLLDEGDPLRESLY